MGQRLSFELEALDGAVVDAAAFEGRVVVVDVWATWCGPCREQEAILDVIADEYERSSVVFLAVNHGEPRDLVEQFVSEDPFTYPVLLDPAQRLGARYGIFALPTILIAGRDATVVYRNVGITPEREIRRAIDEALRRTPG